ncbi:MAG: DUF1579 domain-containing protein [Acidobacteriota bacterium]
MISQKLLSFALLGGLVFSLSYQVFAQGGEKDKKAEMEAMMQEYAKFSQPTAAHKELAKRVGKWDHVTKIWFDPQSPPNESRGITEYKLLLDGRYLLQEMTGEMMGQPYRGMGIVGYDNFKKQYTSAWIDNFSTAIFNSLGTADPASKVVTYLGEMDEPLTGEKNKKVRMVERFIDDDKHIFEMYDNFPGVGEVKVMEITFTRKR